MDSTQLKNTATLRDYVRVIFRQKAVVITSFLSVMVIVFIGLQMKTPVYESQVKMLITTEKQRNVEEGLTRTEIVKSVPVLELTVDALRLYERPLDYEKEFASDIKKQIITSQSREMAAELAEMDPAARQALLYRRAVERVRNNVTVEPIRDTDLFVIKVTDVDREKAAVIANVLSRAYLIIELQQQLAEEQLSYGEKHPSVRQIADNIRNIGRNIISGTKEQIDEYSPPTVKIVEAAIPSTQPTGQPKSLIMILAFCMSGFLSIMLAFIFEYADQTVKTPRELEELLSVTVLGSIPRKPLFQKLILRNVKGTAKHNSAYVTAYHNLADQLRLLTRHADTGTEGERKGRPASIVKEAMSMPKPTGAEARRRSPGTRKQDAVSRSVKSVMVAGAEIQEGVSTTITNLGYYLSQNFNMNVLVIDANFKDPSLQQLFRLKDGPGLAEVLTGKISFGEALHKVNPYLSVMIPGKTHLNLIKYLDSTQMKEILDIAKTKYDIILIDCADLKRYKDAVVMSSYVDSTILLVSESKARRHVIDMAFSPLRENNANIVGSILNNRMFVIPSFIYKRV